MVEKAKEAYDKILSQLTGLVNESMSLENWATACSLLAKGMHVATIAREEDVSVLPFFRVGLKYLRRAPKEMSIELALATLDDSNEFYSFDEEKTVLNAFGTFADRLEEWAEAQDLQHGVYWRVRETTKPWNRLPEDYYEGELPPPYYGWVLVNINKVKNHFDPPGEPYANEVSCNPYHEHLFAYQTTRENWRFHPAIIESLLTQLSDVPEENPLVAKYLEWGAKSLSDIPRSLLKVKDGLVSKELFEQNLQVRDEDYNGLFNRLNTNVARYNADRESELRNAISECLGVSYEHRDPVDVLNEKLDEINKGLKDLWISDDGRWHKLLLTALRLPRYQIHYFDWASRYPEDAPDEPGLVYQLRNGTRQQVHYQIVESRWLDGMDKAEWKIKNIIDTAKNLAVKIGVDAVLNQWFDIETLWKKCNREGETTYHCTGDTDGFSRAFCDGLLKLSVIMPTLRRSVPERPTEDSRYGSVEKSIAMCAKMKPSVLRFQFICNAIVDGMEIACKDDPDFSVWETDWLAAALQLLAEDPCHGSCNIIDRQNMFTAMTRAFEKIAALFSLVQNSDPDATADEFDYFFQDVNDVMSQNVRKHPETGQRGVIITPDFVTREGQHGDWAFNDFFIRRLGSHCTARNAVARFREMAVSEQEQETINGANMDPADCGCGSLSEHLLFQQAISSAGNLIAAIECADDESVQTLISDESVVGAVFQPFFGTYYRPYTTYPKKVEKDKEIGIDIRVDIKQLSDLINRILSRLDKLQTSHSSVSAATKLWKKMSTLYAFRMDNPFVRLSRQKQEEYGQLFIDVVRLISSCTLDAPSGTPSAECQSSSQSDELAELIATKLAKKPIPAVVAGFTKEGRREAVDISNTKKSESDWFSDPNLCILFGVSENTPYNWRKGKSPPEGFREAFERKDAKAMRACAEKYRATHGKSDAMNAKSLERNLSEEQIYNQGGNR